MKFKFIVANLLAIACFSFGCEHEDTFAEATEPVTQSTALSKSLRELLTLKDLYSLQNFDPDNILALRSGGVIVPTAQGEAVLKGRSRTTIGATSVSPKPIPATLNGFPFEFARSNQAKSLPSGISGRLAGASSLTLSIDGQRPQKTAQLIPQPLRLTNLSKLRFGSQGFLVDPSNGLRLTYRPDRSNKAGILVLIEYQRPGFVVQRESFVVEETGVLDITGDRLDWLPTNDDFDIRLIRLGYATFEGGKEDRTLLVATDEIRGAFELQSNASIKDN